MKKKTLLLSVLSLALIAQSSLVAFAGEVKENRNAETTVNVQFTEGDSIIGPVDPEDPTKPIDPEDGGGTTPGESGGLQFVYASNLDFGSHKITGQRQELYSTTKSPNIQIADLRGTGVGWRVEATALPFKDENQLDSLAGSKIVFSNGIATAENMTNIPEANQSIVLKSDGVTSESIFSADTDTGLGHWIMHWIDESFVDNNVNSNILLDVPSSTIKTGTHTGTIQWRLIDAP